MTPTTHLQFLKKSYCTEYFHSIFDVCASYLVSRCRHCNTVSCSYRQRRRAVVLHGDDERVLLLPLAVWRRRPRHHLARHPVHAEGQVLVSGRDVVKQHGVGPNVLVGGCDTED